ncbi:hypothetical protein ENSA5_08980 [Enhygromyxa salina]|uniref:Uncharacterized protein n=1 Tax=Enhygromyxa salina TaxID=215803 RepID=A0A2S9YGM2_9BACT|nr:hypothetical protein ENSA5_08980 [Enhygromyxa salina]
MATATDRRERYGLMLGWALALFGALAWWGPPPWVGGAVGWVATWLLIAVLEAFERRKQRRHPSSK